MRHNVAGILLQAPNNKDNINDWHLFDNQSQGRKCGRSCHDSINTKWHKMLENVEANTGYTHQWREDFAKPFKGIVRACLM